MVYDLFRKPTNGERRKEKKEIGQLYRRTNYGTNNVNRQPYLNRI